MAVLTPDKYDANYFDPRVTGISYRGGYQNLYKKWPSKSGIYVPTEESTGEFFSDIVKMLNPNNSISNKKVLEIGCAKGFCIEAMRDNVPEIQGFGLDISQYAKDNARADIQQYITVADARTYLSNYGNNEFFLLFSRWWIQCIDDPDLPALISEMNRISRNQVHIPFMNASLSDVYNIKTIQEWAAYDWDNGTRLIPHDSLEQMIIV